ncbi:MAG: putative aminopeptidase FrvX [Candidatus Alkanophagales archaeon MCA70_species_2]|nr:putative aminopeptidase FrvX [Candidatus Alkanophaga liquidiphilum]
MKQHRGLVEMEELKALLTRLSDAHGIAGYEDEVRQIVAEELEDYVDEIKVDKLGNLVATKHGSPPSVMLAAHMDEIGLMVKYIEDDGFIRFTKIGGWFDQTLLSQRVVLHGRKGKVVGVVGSKPPHLMKEEERKKAVEAKDMFIDVGASSRKEVEDMGIMPGTPVTLDRELTTLVNGRVTGKALDNRAGVTMMIEALRRTDAKCTIHAVATVQEEVGLKGARTSAFELNPDVAVATEIAVARQLGVEKKDAAIELDKGPVITVSDAAGRGIITPPLVLRWLTETAEKHKIEYQLSVSEGGTTDATAIFLTRSGVPAGVVSVPARYIHSPVEVLSLKDLDRCAELLAKALENAADYF